MSKSEVCVAWAGDAPLLETERLLMRGPKPEDFPAFAAMWADRDVVRYITKDPMNEEDAWSGFLRVAGHWQMTGYGYWMVLEKETNTFLGEVGFVDFKRNMTPSIKGEPEIGWVFAKAAHGKGYATEAAKVAVKWGDAQFSGARMSCIINTPHVASIRVAEKCGFKETAKTIYKGDEIAILHRDPPQ